MAFSLLRLTSIMEGHQDFLRFPNMVGSLCGARSIHFWFVLAWQCSAYSIEQEGIRGVRAVRCKVRF